ncbi:MAG TPA: twin-arginine translocation signal domain-containing protein [Thermoanaerobaculia bacterium]|nr:twin-arginine translocation signal domain-containing protein [Thermoanaerobaculia bacterium]
MNEKDDEVSPDNGIARRNFLKLAGAGAVSVGLGSHAAVLEAQAQQIRSALETHVVRRAARNTARFLANFSSTYQTFLNQSLPLRLQIFSDVLRLFNSLAPRDRGCLLSLLAIEVRDQTPFISSLQGGDAETDEQGMPQPDPEVGMGQEDLSECKAIGIEVTTTDRRGAKTTVGAGVCPEHDLSGIEGGGFWARFEY